MNVRWSSESALARRLLATSSLVALMAAAAAPTPVRAAACVASNTNVSITGCTNAGTLPSLSFTNATSSGSVINSGTISPGGISLANSTVFGAISDLGTITGGIVVDAKSLVEIGADGISILATSTFGGGISNGGVIQQVNIDGILVNGVSTFAGDIINSGTIVGSAVHSGIVLESVSTFSGNINNSGTISAGFLGIGINGISTFNGGISNSGTVKTNDTVIHIGNVSTFTGGLSNSGTISGGVAIALAGIETFAGGITNSSTGIIKASIVTLTAIEIVNVSTFAGNISNAGTISASGLAINITGGSAFIGNFSNTGTISANGTALIVGENTFIGNIVNAGTITSSGFGNGIEVQVSGTFAGGILNVAGGVISARQTGILVRAGTFTGGIVNDGAITATNGDGIRVTNSVSAGFAGGIANGGNIAANLTGILIGTLSSFAGGVSNSGTITANVDGLFVNAVSTFTGGIANAGTISVHGTAVRVDTVTQFSGGIVNGSGGTISGADIGVFVNAVGSTFAGGISNSGMISGGTKALLVQGVGNFAGDLVNNGTLSSPGGRGISIASVSTFAGNVSNAGVITAATGIRIGAGVGFSAGTAIVNSGTISGTVAAIDASAATGPLTIDQNAGVLGGAVNLAASATLNVAGGSINGNVVAAGSNDTINFNLGSGTFIYGNAFNFSGINSVNVGSGTIILDGSTNQTTNTTVNGGTLVVGDTANPGAKLVTNTVIVNGGALAGTGTIDPGGTAVTINSGGTLAPGASGSIGTLTIGGSLSINSGSFYDVSVNDTAASKTLVNSAPGTATISGGTVVVTPAYTTLGVHGGTTFAILTAANGLAGTFSGLTVNSGSFTGSFALSYGADDAFLNVGTGIQLLPVPVGATVNEENVFNGINHAVLAGNTVPNGFNQLLGLSGTAYLNALNQLDGENATGAQRGAYDLMNDFLNLMLDPAAGGGSSMSGGGATGFAPEQDTSLSPDVALAYAKALNMPLKAPQPQAPQTFDQRWTAWGSAFGGTSFTNGNAAIGSNNVTASDYGFAAGMDYHATPNTVYGFALAGGGTNWNLAQALGSGRSDSFQAGVYAKTHWGPLYFSGALAFANHWFTTNRIAMDDQLHATFMGQSYAVRSEAGYRYAVPITGAIVGVTPYAALQAQDFHTPSYSETDLTGGGFGLSYASMNATDTRSELGARFDNLQVVNGMPLVLRGRLAWAHDWFTNATALNAVFETLPGSNFTVNGAAPPKNSALTTAAAELHITPNWTAIAKFDGAFGSGSQTYGGTGTLRYSW